MGEYFYFLNFEANTVIKKFKSFAEKIFKIKDLKDEFFKFYGKEIITVNTEKSDAEIAMKILHEQRILNNQNTIDKLRRTGVTNEYFKDQAQKIMELRSVQGALDMKTRKTLQKFIMKYANNANTAFKEMQNVGQNNELDKKIEGCLKAYTQTRSAALFSKSNNWKKYNDAANSIRKNLIELYKEKYPDMQAHDVVKFIGSIN